MTNSLLHPSSSHDEDEEWKKMKNTDELFRMIYAYYTSKGISAIILQELSAVVTLAFTIVVSVYLITFVDWSALMSCHDEISCEGVQNSIQYNPFEETPSSLTMVVTLYALLFTFFWIWRCINALKEISKGFQMERFYREKLNINQRELRDMEWHKVVERLILAHNAQLIHVVNKDKLSVHDIVLRIMRKDNYLIALINKNRLSLQVPWWLSPFSTEGLFFTKSMEWSLSFCIMDSMFVDRSDIPAEYFFSSVDTLKWRFQVVGLFHFLLMPFMLIFMTVHFFLSNAQQFHSTRAYLGPRQWSPLATWQLREFNELPHTFEERLNKAYAPGIEYLSSFHNVYITILARCFTFISGAIVAILLLLSIVSEGALLYIHIADRNLFWYLSIFTAIFAGARSMVPDETLLKESPEFYLQNMCSFTHYFPEHWNGNENTLQVRQEVADLLKYKFELFIKEVFSVVLTPVVLCFSLPSCAPSVIEFLKRHTRIIDDVGAVCDYRYLEILLLSPRH